MIDIRESDIIATRRTTDGRRDLHLHRRAPELAAATW
jgi:hypothetical protein